MPELKEVEPIDFKYTTISLNDAYDLSFKNALEIIRDNGGEVKDDSVVIKLPKTKNRSTGSCLCWPFFLQTD